MADDFESARARLFPQEKGPQDLTQSSAQSKDNAPQLAATALSSPHGSLSKPASSPLLSAPLSGDRDENQRTSPSSLRRSPSTQSLASTSSTTTNLKKKTSMGSLQGFGGRTPPRSPISSSRRSSTSFSRKLSTTQDDIPPPLPLTPGQVAKDYFKRDLEAHLDHNDPSYQSRAAVIVHDACYGHRFSRPRTSKATLSTIVERPERIRATILGISTAYVLLGGRHSGGINAPHPKSQPGASPFIIRKSSRRVPLSFSAVTNVHGTNWMAELQEMCEAAEAKLTTNGKELMRPNGRIANDDEEKPKLHEGDLYLCSESLAAFEGALGGVLDAVDLVFSPNGPRRCFACVRPPGHHCSNDYPSGFCWLNNIHVGISYGASSHGLTHAAIFDFDLHHGDGSQSIAWAHNQKVSGLPRNASISKKTRIGYFSLHDINSYPCEWGDEEKVRNASLCIENAHGQTMWNVHLQPWKTEADFWKLYNDRYSVLLEKMRGFLRTQNEKYHALGQGAKSRGAIFISAGFDASEWEGHGMQRHEVNVPTDFYARVTRDIAKMSEEEALGVDGRVISVLEGGYSDRALMSGALSHICGLASFPRDKNNASNSIANAATTTPNTILPDSTARESPSSFEPYQHEWWSALRLAEIENVVTPSPIAPASRKPRGGPAPTYQTPTQSFVAKVVSPPTYQRSISGSSMARASPTPRLPTPPPPDVEWTVASQELSQLLIPNDRITKSCRPEDLTAKATEARKQRQSLIGTVSEAPAEEMQKMQLRDRKIKPPDATADGSRPSSRAGAARRRTIGGVEALDKEATSTSRRRVSVASSVLSNSDDSHAGGMSHQLEPLAPPKQRAPSRTRASNKAPVKRPVPRVPSNYKQDVAIRRQKAAPSTSLPPPQQPSDSEMANLASDVKKLSIKLNVPSREEYEAREARKQAAVLESNGTSLKAPRKSTVKKPTKESSRTVKSKQPPNAEIKEVNHQPDLPNTTLKFEHDLNSSTPAMQHSYMEQSEGLSPDSTGVPVSTYVSGSYPTTIKEKAPPSFQPPDSATLTATITAPMPGLPDFPMTGVDPPAIPSSTQTSSEQMPLGTASAPPSTLSSPKPPKPNHLPVFTSSSPIPFGPSRKIEPENVLQNKSTNTAVGKELDEEPTDKQATVDPFNGPS